MPALPTRIPASEFTADSDLLAAILNTEPVPASSLVELSSAKSGLRLSFNSNRECCQRLRPRISLNKFYGSESGVQFYSNNLTNEKNGARKKIHGGSGVSGAGGSYNAGSAYRYLILQMIRELTRYGSLPPTQLPPSWSFTSLSRRGSILPPLALPEATPFWHQEKSTTISSGWMFGLRARLPKFR